MRPTSSFDQASPSTQFALDYHAQQASLSTNAPAINFSWQNEIDSGSGATMQYTDLQQPPPTLKNSINSKQISKISKGSTSSNTNGSLTDSAKSTPPPLARGSACSICRKRKLRCDGIRPSCSTCIRLKHHCQYGDPLHEKLTEKTRILEERLRKSTEKTRLLEDQVQAMEKELDGHRSRISQEVESSTIPTRNGYAAFNVPQQDSPSSVNSRKGVLSPTESSAHAETRSILPSVVPQPPGFGPMPTNPYLSSEQPPIQFADMIHQYGSHHHHPDSMSSSTAAFEEAGSTNGHFGQASIPQTSTPTPPVTGLSGYDFNEWSSAELTLSWGHALPPMDLVLDLNDLYFNSIHKHLPFLHRPHFLYSLNNPASLAAPPSLSLIFAVLAIAAPYHNNPSIRASAQHWYECSREKIEIAIEAGMLPSGARKASLTLEMVQALCILTMIEMGRCDHQRAFMSIGQAIRIAAMLGLHRMDEDRIADMVGSTIGRRLRPPTLHQLPTDSLQAEECRRTMCAAFVLDRFEASTVGWPPAISEGDLRLLLPCAEELYESGMCQAHNNPLWWPLPPMTLETEEDTGPSISAFAWLCRVVWLGGRIQTESYRPSGLPPGGPFNQSTAGSAMDDANAVIELDHQLDYLRLKLNSLVSSSKKGLDAPLIMVLIVLNCLFVNAHHLRVAMGLSQFPFDSNAPIVIGSAEYSMQRCLEGVRSLRDIVVQLSAYENVRTSIRHSRVTVFTSFAPYILFCIAFPAKFFIGDWSLLGQARSRSEDIPGRVVVGSANPDLPSGDECFGPVLDDDRLQSIDVLLEGMNRMGLVWDVGNKFYTMVRGDRQKLGERIFERRSSHSQFHGFNHSVVEDGGRDGVRLSEGSRLAALVKSEAGNNSYLDRQQQQQPPQSHQPSVGGAGGTGGTGCSPSLVGHLNSNMISNTHSISRPSSTSSSQALNLAPGLVKQKTKVAHQHQHHHHHQQQQQQQQQLQQQQQQ